MYNSDDGGEGDGLFREEKGIDRRGFRVLISFCVEGRVCCTTCNGVGGSFIGVRGLLEGLKPTDGI